MIIKDDRLAWLVVCARNNIRRKWTKHRIEWEISDLHVGSNMINKLVKIQAFDEESIKI